MPHSYNEEGSQILSGKSFPEALNNINIIYSVLYYNGIRKMNGGGAVAYV